MMGVNLMFEKVYRQMYRAVQVHGLLGTFQLAAEKLRRYGRGGSASGAAGSPTVSTFDQKWNVQTDGNEDLSELQVIDRTNYLLGNRYQPTSPEMFEQILQAHPLPYEECIFIDCGSGKGRVLLMASELPFRRIIGVEFASDLTEIAQANIQKYHSPTQKCWKLEAVCADATIFHFPVEPTVLYMANPFEGVVMEKFLSHVENSLREHPRPFFVLYRQAKYASLWDKSKYFLKVSATEKFVVYKGL
jgi:hypothetical protein